MKICKVKKHQLHEKVKKMRYDNEFILSLGELIPVEKFRSKRENELRT